MAPGRPRSRSLPRRPPQTPAPQLTFRAEGNYIEVDAIVTDAQGNFVRDLTVNDFEVSEEKKAQAIDVFTLVDIPLERADAPLYRKNPIEPDVATNERENDGRLYVIVLDGNHVPPTDTILVKNVAKQFIQQNVGANDQAAVVLIQTGTSNDNQEFTSDKIALMRSVDKFIGEKIKSKALAVQTGHDQPVRRWAARASTHPKPGTRKAPSARPKRAARCTR